MDIHLCGWLYISPWSKTHLLVRLSVAPSYLHPDVFLHHLMVKLIPQQDTNWALIQFTPQNISLTLKYRVKKIKNRKLKISHLAIWHMLMLPRVFWNWLRACSGPNYQLGRWVPIVSKTTLWFRFPIKLNAYYLTILTYRLNSYLCYIFSAWSLISLRHKIQALPLTPC